MGDNVRITVIATGFERATVASRRLTPTPRPENKPIGQTTTNATSKQPAKPQDNVFQPQTFDTDDLDIPTFLRKRMR